MDNQEPSLKDVFFIIRRGLVLALVVAALMAVAAYFISERLEPTYSTRAELIASQSNPDLGRFDISLTTAPPIDFDLYENIALSNSVLADAAQQLGGGSALEGVDFNVNVDDRRISSLVYVRAEGSDPTAIAGAANALAQALLSWDRRRSEQSNSQVVSIIEERIAGYDEQIEELEGSLGPATQEQYDALVARRDAQRTQLSEARAQLDTSTKGRLEILDPAPIPTEPIAPDPVRNAALAFVLGVFLSYGLLLLRDALDSRLKSSEDLAKLTGLPILAEFQKQPPGTRRLPREASNYLRTNLLLSSVEAGTKIILVTSATPGEGKSSVALSVAESFARSDRRTLLVDADLRRPVIAQNYDLDEIHHKPLRAYLEQPNETFEPAYVALNLTHHLDVIPTFQAEPSPTELLSRGFRQRLDAWRGSYDVIIIDSAPLLSVADTLTVAPLCTGVILTANLQSSDRRGVRAAVDLLRRIGVRLLGLAVTGGSRVPAGSSDYSYTDAELEPDFPRELSRRGRRGDRERV